MLPSLWIFEGLPFAQFKAPFLLLDETISFIINIFFDIFWFPIPILIDNLHLLLHPNLLGRPGGILLVDIVLASLINLFFPSYLVVEGLVNTWVLGSTMDNARHL
uniref:Uncharacterized protein n=1 Tax=Populus davidiana TaxID=266767 RepID=A0A6M2FAL9_9ROSI